MVEIIGEIGTLLTGFVALFGGWFFGRAKMRHENAEERQETIKLLSKRVDELMHKMLEMQKENTDLKYINNFLKKEVEVYGRLEQLYEFRHEAKKNMDTVVIDLDGK